MKPSREPRPAFQTYAADELADASEMTLEELGARLLLRAYAWREGSIPADHQRLARLLRVTEQKLAEMWPAIGRDTVDAGADRLVFPKLEELRAEYEAYSASRSAAAKTRWEAERARNAYASARASTHALHTECSSSSTPTPTSSTTSTATTTDTESPSASLSLVPEVPRFDLEALYSPYPRKEAKAAGMRALKSAIKTETDYDQFMQATAHYAAHLKFNPDRPAMLFSTWCNGRWRDWIDGAPAGSSAGAARSGAAHKTHFRAPMEHQAETVEDDMVGNVKVNGEWMTYAEHERRKVMAEAEARARREAPVPKLRNQLPQSTSVSDETRAARKF